MQGVRMQSVRTVVMGAVLSLLAASCIIGPVPNSENISVGIGYDLGDFGYDRSEFFVIQSARSYAAAGPLAADGKWTVTPDAAKAPFATRMVVHRPVDPADFNGTVIVEWLNVTAGTDLANDWVMAHNEFLRDGYAWVGVSAQAVGVNNAKARDPLRYGGLSHPGDSYSYDMFTHAAKDIRDDPAVLGGLPVDRMIATGESQSASRLVTYINAIHPIEEVFDGFMVHSRGAGGSSLRQAPLGQISTPRPAFLRDDLDVPVMVVQSEDDVIRSDLQIRQPDTAMFRAWEMAGTAHADAYTITVGFGDIGDGAGTSKMFDFMRAPLDAGCAKPVSSGPHWLILQAAFDGLDRWVRTGEPPAVASHLVAASTDPTVLERDEQGIAVGGVRTPHVDVPVATIDGLNSGPVFCGLFGSTTPLSTAELAALYPTHYDFVDAWTDSVQSAIAAGFILPEDGPDLLVAAANSSFDD